MTLKNNCFSPDYSNMTQNSHLFVLHQWQIFIFILSLLTRDPTSWSSFTSTLSQRPEPASLGRTAVFSHRGRTIVKHERFTGAHCVALRPSARQQLSATWVDREKQLSVCVRPPSLHSVSQTTAGTEKYDYSAPNENVFLRKNTSEIMKI